MKRVYPKVLILCDRFDNNTGMGVTLANLFKEWPKESLAIAGFSINRDICNAVRPCIDYFALDGRFITDVTKPKATKRSVLRRLLKYVYTKIGMDDFVSIPISDRLKEFIDKFNPDIIFSALGDIKRVNFTNSVADYCRAAKLAIYIVDDWPDSRFSGRWLEKLWSHRYFSAVKQIVGRADVCLSICQKMSDVYKERYGKRFLPFHNPVQLDEWKRIGKHQKDDFSIVYVGKINRDTYPSLMKLAQCVEESDKNIKFDIYTPNYPSFEFENFKRTAVNPPVSNSEIPALLKSYSLLFLSLGFSEETRNYVKLSMPTKLTEYLAADVPILLYAPDDIALTEYLKLHKAAYICSDEEKLSEAVNDLVSNKDERDAIRKNAQQLVLLHDAPLVRENFRRALSI